jgi:hypothetical protein
MCGRLRVGKDFLHVLQHWSVQPCVRPFNAVHMTAGHNALRGSGPDQTPAFDNASTQVGCPDRRIDQLCITCCSPSQPSHHAGCPAKPIVVIVCMVRSSESREPRRSDRDHRRRCTCQASLRVRRRGVSIVQPCAPPVKTVLRTHGQKLRLAFWLRRTSANAEVQRFRASR